MLNNVIYIYSFTNCLPDFSQDFHPSVITLISNTFVQLLGIPAPFFLLFTRFTLAPQPHAPYPTISVLPHTFIWNNCHVVGRSCQLSTAQGYHRSVDEWCWMGRAGRTCRR